jgi:Fic family protein
MAALERYINEINGDLPIAINLALVHYQFEAIHPFPDGNGRVGRLLLPLILCELKEISQPLLYLSTFFEKNYDEYIDKMLDVSRYGLWENWIEFFLRGVEETSADAIAKARKLQDLQLKYHEKIRIARSSVLLGQIVDKLFEQPAITIPIAARDLEIAYNGAKNNLKRLVDHGVLREASYESRPKVFFASEIIDLMAS